MSRALMTRSRMTALGSPGSTLEMSLKGTGVISHWMSIRSKEKGSADFSQLCTTSLFYLVFKFIFSLEHFCSKRILSIKHSIFFIISSVDILSEIVFFVQYIIFSLSGNFVVCSCNNPILIRCRIFNILNNIPYGIILFLIKRY